MESGPRTRTLYTAGALLSFAVILGAVIRFTDVSTVSVLVFGGLVVLGALVVRIFVGPSATTDVSSPPAQATASAHDSSSGEVIPVRTPRTKQGSFAGDVSPDPSAEEAQGPPAAAPADPPSTQRPAAVATATRLSTAPRPEIRIPPTLESSVVVDALFQAAKTAGTVVAAHLWLEDPSSATLRLVHATGSMAPSGTPLPLDDGIPGDALAKGKAILASVATLSDPRGSRLLWRYAIPLDAGEYRGVAAVDFASLEEPDRQQLTYASVALRGALSGSLALHVARTEAATGRTLVDVARELSRQLDPGEVVTIALDQAMTMAHGATGSIMLFDDESSRLTIVASQGLPDDVVATASISQGEGISGWVFATNKALLVEDLPGRKRGAPRRRKDVRSAVSVPIADEDGVLGVLNVGSKAYPARFTRSHMTALEILGRQTAVALRNAHAVSSARELYLSSLKALALALETKDPYSRGSTERVVDGALALGKAVGMTDTELHALELAALFHDLGMTAAGQGLVLEGRQLSTVEQGVLKMHPVIAAEVLEEVPALIEVIPIVYHHHERFDGEGYVAGLAGESIPLGARVLAVVDSFVAMTTERPYRDARTPEEALRELTEHAGTQFDPAVVDEFVRLVRSDTSRAKEQTGTAG